MQLTTLLVVASVLQGSAFRSTRVSRSNTRPEPAKLWDHLKKYVLPHRKRLSSFIELKGFSSTDLSASEASDEVKASFAEALPAGMNLTQAEKPSKALHLYIGADCGSLETSQRLWAQMEPGAVVAVPICSHEEFDTAFGLLYNVNCPTLWGNHKCGKTPGPKLTCEDFQYKGLDRIGFVSGYFILEKVDEETQMKQLGNGDFLLDAMQASPPTDKVTKHHYQLVYERYFPSKRSSSALSLLQEAATSQLLQKARAKTFTMERYFAARALPHGRLLEIGLGCNMDYGPGKSADLWRTYFPSMNISFLEYNGKCVQKWESTMRSKGITVYVGDQNDAAPNERMAKEGGSVGYDIIVDDGEHTNKAIRTSFHYLWPAVAKNGFYVIEDLGEPAFSYMDCEPLQSPAQKQTTTAIAKVVDEVRPLVLQASNAEVARAECDMEICLLQRA